MQNTAAREREILIKRVLGTPVPRLWCPPITHYTDAAELDIGRMANHWRAMAPYVGGFLVPGSTGDGWEMDEEEIARTLAEAVRLAVELDSRVLVGVLRTDVDSVLAVINSTLGGLKRTTGVSDPVTAMERSHVAGFTVCPPAGADLSQDAIRMGLEAVLDLGLPTAVYQLPQVTGNEISTDVFGQLAARYANFLMFKDTSGEDHVALADRGSAGVFLVRGAEGDYARWLHEAGGPYAGLLLSTANCFAAELRQMITLLEGGRLAEARALSHTIAIIVKRVFAAVGKIQAGNAFANANKALDHARAYGTVACLKVPPPMLHAGVRLPIRAVQAAREALLDGGMSKATGYLPASPPEGVR